MTLSRGPSSQALLPLIPADDVTKPLQTWEGGCLCFSTEGANCPCALASVLYFPDLVGPEHPSCSISQASGLHLCSLPIGLGCPEELPQAVPLQARWPSAKPLCILCISPARATGLCACEGPPEQIRTNIFLPGCPQLSLLGIEGHFFYFRNKRLRTMFHLQW